MIQALPQQLNSVILKNPARSQQVHGKVWIGELSRPLLTIVQLSPGEKPITVEGYDILGVEDGGRVAYGDKRLIRYEMDTEIDARNRLLFFGTAPGGAEGRLARWLSRKGGDAVSNEGVLKISQHLQDNPHLLDKWCTKQEDLFQPATKLNKASFAYLVYAEPPPETLKSIMSVAQAPELQTQPKAGAKGKKAQRPLIPQI